MSEQVSQYLRVSSPSSTAVKYTVSSSTREPTMVITVIKYALRVAVAFYAVLALIAKLELTFSAGLSFTTTILLKVSLLNGLLQAVLDSLEWWVVLVTSFFTLYLCVRRGNIGWETYLVIYGDLLTSSRRKSFGIARLGYTNFNQLSILLPKRNHNVHTDYADPGYRDTRSIQRI